MAIKNFHDLSAEERKAHEARRGGFNDFPPKWKELTAAEFAKSTFFGWHPELFEHRQMWSEDKEMQKLMAYKHGSTYVSTTIWWMPSGEGFALVNDFWGGTIRYFQCGERDPDWLKGMDSSD